MDKDFRSRFVNKRQQETKRAASSLNLASMHGTPPPVRFLEEMQHGDEGEGSATGHTPEPQPLTFPKTNMSASSSPPKHPSTLASATIDSDDSDDGSPLALLPRTKSQLSMIIAEDRRLSETSGKGKASQNRVPS